MKRIISALALAALLMAGLAVLQPAANAQTQGARSKPLYLDNSEVVSSSLSGKQTVAVSVKPVNRCQPRNTLIADGEYTLQPQGTNTGSNDQIVGILDSLCNYEITYSDAAGQCPVNVTLIDADGNGVGAVITNQRPLAVNVDYNSGDITTNGSGAFVRIHFQIDRSDSNACGSVFQPNVNITVPTGAAFTANGVSVYAGSDFEVAFAPVAGYGSGCTAKLSRTMTITNAGAATWKSDVAGQAAFAPSLTDISRAERRAATSRQCRYSVVFPSEVNNLVRQPSTKTWVAANTQTNPADNVVSAVYQPKSVDISVTAVFEDDEVFTTDDKIAVSVKVNPPCGGLIAALPQTLFGQADRNEIQIFPGELTVYGKALNAISNTAATYSVPAFADPKGTQPCSVTATVSLSGTAAKRCGVIEPSRTAAYSSGTDDLTFKFSFLCNGNTAAAEENSDAAETEASASPPAPPTITLDGPPAEGLTG